MKTYVEDKTAGDPVHKPFLRKYSGALLLLLTLAAVALGWSALTPSLMGDEWGYLFSHIRYGGPICPGSATDARPLGMCWVWLVYQLAGTNVFGYHAFGIMMNLLSALLLLATLDVLLPDWPTYNMAVAALYLVFPADMTRTWLAGNIVQGTAFFLLAAYFMARFWRDGRWWAWLASMIVVAISLSTYEITLGVIITLSGLAFLFSRRRTWPQRLGLLAPMFMTIGFGLWRWRWQQSVGAAFGHDINQTIISAQLLARRLWVGAEYLLGEAWGRTLLELLPFTPRPGRITSALESGALIGLMMLVILIAYWGGRKIHRFDLAGDHRRAEKGNMLDLAIAGAVGLAILAAGYFPIIIAMNPGISYGITRAHHLPSVGAAMFICAVLFGVSQWLGRTQEQAQFIALTGLASLLVIGALGHITVTRQLREAWADQKLIWNSLFEQAPDIVDGTQVLFLLEGYDDPGRGPRPFVSGPWSLSRALQLLYDNDELSAYFVPAWSPGMLSIDKDLTLTDNDGNIIDFSAAETLVFLFNRADQELTQVKELESNGKTLLLGPDRIIPTPTNKTEWRWLVAD